MLTRDGVTELDERAVVLEHLRRNNNRKREGCVRTCPKEQKMRFVVSFVLAFAVSAAVGRVLIPWLRALKAGQSIKEIGPVWHMSKQGTPTMGGVMFIVGILVAILAAGWPDFRNGDFGALFVYLFALVFGAIGFFDDYMKVKHHKNEGLTAPQKFLLQLAAAIAFTVLLRYTGYLTPDLYIPLSM